MGHVRVVACVLEGAGFGTIGLRAAELQAHGYHFAFGQGDFHGVMADAAEQKPGGGQAGGRGATAGGQAAAQGRGLFGGFVTHQRVWSSLTR